MKDRESLNTTVKTELKKFFEDTRNLGLHEMSFGEFMDQKIRELAVSFNQAAFIDQAIAQKDIEINKLLQEKNELSNLKLRISQLKAPAAENKNNGNSPELEQRRLTLFEGSKESVIKLWQKGDINWERVVASYKFTDKREAQEWFRKKIEGT